MNWELTSRLLNLLGIVLQFLSFWLVAPEILGEDRLKALERRLEKGTRLAPSVAMVAVLLSVSMVAVLAPVMPVPPPVPVAAEAITPHLVAMAALLLVTVVLATAVLVPVGKVPPVVAVAGVVLVAAVAAVALLVRVAAVPLMAALAGVALTLLAAVAAGVAVVAVANQLLQKVVAPVLRVLADDERLRQRSLAVGAVLFIIAFLYQFAAALFGISGP